MRSLNQPENFDIACYFDICSKQNEKKEEEKRRSRQKTIVVITRKLKKGIALIGELNA